MYDDEVDAIRALQRGDISGLACLVRRYQLPALRTAYNLCRDQATAEDAISDAFLSVHHYIASYDTSRPFKPWFYRIVINSVRATMRSNRRSAVVADAQNLLNDRPDPSMGPEEIVVRREDERELLQAIDRLPEKQREVIVLRYFLDMDERTMSAVLGVPSGTVKWRLFQARKRLHRHMRERGDVSGALAGEAK